MLPAPKFIQSKSIEKGTENAEICKKDEKLTAPLSKKVEQKVKSLVAYDSDSSLLSNDDNDDNNDYKNDDNKNDFKKEENLDLNKNQNKDQNNDFDFFSLNKSVKPASLINSKVNKIDNIYNNDNIAYVDKNEFINMDRDTIGNDNENQQNLISEYGVDCETKITKNDNYLSNDKSCILSNEEYKRLTGSRKRQHEIQLIDINADSLRNQDIDILKQLTEQQETIYNGALLSSGSKQKHQITYLGLQAKQMEIHLKNKWAKTRDDRRKSRMKYGF